MSPFMQSALEDFVAQAELDCEVEGMEWTVQIAALVRRAYLAGVADFGGMIGEIANEESIQ